MKKLLSTIFALCLAGAIIKAQCPVANAGPDQTVCKGTTVTLAATLPTSFSGTWTKVGFGTTYTITTTTNATSTVTGLTATAKLVWTITDGASCTAIRDTVVITIQSSPTSANAGADKTICVGGTATLSATAAPVGSIGTWSKVLTGGHTSSSSVITSVSSPTTTVTGLNSAGSSDTLRWTVSNALCGGTVIDDAIIVVNAAPTPANAGLDINAGCQGDTVQLIGNIPTFGTPLWTLPTGSGAAFVPATASNKDTVKVTTTTGGGKISITYKISTGTGATVLNGCMSVDTVVVTFNPSVANAGPDQNICQTPGTITLAATPVAAGETGVWTFVKHSGNEVITNSSSPTTTVTAITSDTLTLRWTVNGGGCSDTDDMNVIKLVAPSVAVAGQNASGSNDVTSCVGDTIRLIGSFPTSGTPKWTIAPTTGGGFGGAGVSFVPNGNNDTVRVRLRTAGTYKLYYTISVSTSTVISTDPCITSRDSLNIFVNALPTATIVAPAGGGGFGGGGGTANQTNCNSAITTYTVTARAPATGSTGVWSIVAPGTGTVVQTDTVGIVSGLAQGVTTLAWTVNNGICSRKATMTITASVPTIASAGNDKTGCVGDTITLYGNTPTSGTPTWSNAHPPARGAGFPPKPTPKSIRFIPTNGKNDTVKVVLDTAGTFTLYYTIAVGTSTVSACSSRDSMKVTVTKCTTGITENKKGDLTVTVQPNPASGWFNLSLKDTQISVTEVSILTIDGRIVETEQLGSVKDIVTTINISNLSDGMYFVKVKKGNEVIITKLIVH